MNKTITGVAVEFRAKSALRFAADVHVSYGPLLEASLACATCRRNHRTIRIGLDGAQCLKASHAFDARIRDWRIESTYGLSIVTYDVAFTYQTFTDATTNEPSVRYPRWGRIAFQATCPGCGAESSHATQTNLKRPWLVACKCGRELYVEAGQLPLFEIGA